MGSHQLATNTIMGLLNKILLYSFIGIALTQPLPQQGSESQPALDPRQIENWTGQMYNQYRPAAVQDNSIGSLVSGVFDMAEQQTGRLQNDQMRDFANGMLNTLEENANRQLAG